MIREHLYWTRGKILKSKQPIKHEHKTQIIHRQFNTFRLRQLIKNQRKLYLKNLTEDDQVI